VSVKQQPLRASLQAGAETTYFVGRRPFENPEVYAVTGGSVHRLRSVRRYGESSLDWDGADAARMELSHLLIGAVVGERPSRDLQARFALYVLARLPRGGFVLDSNELRRWLRLASDTQDFAPERPRRSWAGRVVARLRRTAIPADD
jgi:hypothetical protein